MKIDAEFAGRFAADWVESWNTHNLDRILGHYADDFEMSSPIVVTLMGEESGRLKGKEAVGRYWKTALERQPQLHFELVNAYAGVGSVVVEYEGPRGRGAEVYFFGEDGLVTHGFAHYAVPKS